MQIFNILSFSKLKLFGRIYIAITVGILSAVFAEIHMHRSKELFTPSHISLGFLVAVWLYKGVVFSFESFMLFENDFKVRFLCLSKWFVKYFRSV